METATAKTDAADDGHTRCGAVLLVCPTGPLEDSLGPLMHDDTVRLIRACSGAEALRLLRDERIEVVVTEDQVSGAPGLEFLRAAAQVRPGALRIALLARPAQVAVAEALNDGVVHKFLPAPVDPALLCATLQEALARRALEDENRRLDLELRRANDALARSNEHLRAALEEQRRRLLLGEGVLRMAKECLDFLPVPVLGIDPLGRVAFANFAAHEAAGEDWPIGAGALEVLPAALAECLAASPARRRVAALYGRDWWVDARALGRGELRGTLLTLLPQDAPAAAAAEPAA